MMRNDMVDIYVEVRTRCDFVLKRSLSAIDGDIISSSIISKYGFLEMFSLLIFPVGYSY